MTSTAHPRPSDKLLILLFAMFIAAVAISPGSAVRAQSPGSGSDGTRTLSVSRATGVAPEGEVVTVSGSGYNSEKGIYVAFCVIPAPGQTPSPCGGGADISGGAGVSVWISSNPPSYAGSLAKPYGPGGTFTGSLAIRAMLNDSTDCRVVACAVVTRNDHTRGTDRSQDVYVPISFATPPTPTQPPATATAPTTTPPGSTTTAPSTPSATTTPTPTVTTEATPTATASPTAVPTRLEATLSTDRQTATAGSMSLTASKTEGISQGGETITVRGSGFDTGAGVFVALCQAPFDRATQPGPCAGGSEETSAWVSSNPPDYGKDRAKAYGEGGAFEVSLKISPVIDAKTDCRVLSCAITTRRDDTAAGDRTADVLIPVSFSDAEPPTAAAQPGDEVSDSADDGGSGSTAGWLIAGAVIAVIALAGAAFAVIRSRGGGAAAASIIALIAVLIVGCSGDADPDSGDDTIDAPIVVGDSSVSTLPVTVTSADGRQVTVTDTSRIVPLWGNITEVVFGLGMGEHVVGRDVSATFPEAANLPTVTRGHDISAEGILSLKPTLILASADNSGPSTALDQIRSVGIPVVVFEDPTSIEDVIPRIRAIAATLGVPDAGEELVAETEGQLAAAQAAIPDHEGTPRVAFLYMRGQAGVYLIGGPGSGADSMIRAAGADDAGTAMGLKEPFTPITSESMAAAAPDIILMTSSGLASVGGIEGLVKVPGIAQTPAGQQRRVVTVEDSLLYSFGPRTPAALTTLIALLYPSESTVRNP